MSKIRSQISYYDLTGGLNNVNTMDTLNSSPKKTESPDMVNVEFFKLGGIKSMDGNIAIGDQQYSSVVGGWEYTKKNNKYMIIALYNGEVKRFDPVTETFVKLFQFPHSSNRVSFCNMNNGFVATNGIDDLMFYEYGRHHVLSGAVSTTAGSNEIIGQATEFETELKPGDTVQLGADITHTYTVTSITNNTHLTLDKNVEEALSDVSIYLSEVSVCNATLVNEEDPNVNTPIRGTAIQFYNGRLWVGGENGVFYSQVGQYDKWDIKYDAGVIYSIYNDTSEVKALGLYSDYMLIHKEFNTYLLTLTGVANGENSTLSVRPYSNVSCDSQQSWIVSNTKYYVYSRENMDIFPLSQRTIFSDRYLGDAITNKVRNVFQNLRDADLEKIFCVSLPRKRWMLFYMPMVDQLGSSYALIYDFQCKAFVVRKVPQTVTIAFNYQNEVYIGTEDGLVLKEFTGTSFNGEVINAYYKSPWFDWAGDYYQSFAEFAIDMASEYNNNFYIRTFKDGDSPYEDRIVDDSSLITTGLIWDGGEYIPEFNYIFKSNPMTIYNFVDDEDNQYYMYTNNPTIGDWIYEIDEDSKVAVGSIDKIETIDNVKYYQSIKYNLETGIDEPFISVCRPNNPADISEYMNVSNIPKIDPETTEDTTTYIDENVYITSKKNGDDLEIYKVYPDNSEEVLLSTVNDYYITGKDIYLNGHIENNDTTWDTDVWTSGNFNSIRMLLPNNAFETFQLEIGTNTLGQAFAIYGYNFRRLETEEAPW